MLKTKKGLCCIVTTSTLWVTKRQHPISMLPATSTHATAYNSLNSNRGANFGLLNSRHFPVQSKGFSGRSHQVRNTVSCPTLQC